MEKQGGQSGRRAMSEFRRQEEEVIGSLCRLGSRGAVSPKSQIEQEKRIRREIANSNERRRMQSINAGFQSLRVLLPQRDGEKMSKAAILQHTAEYIYQLEQEKTRLLAQHCNLKRLLQQNGIGSFSNPNDSDNSDSGSKMPLKRKRTVDSVESADEGIGMSPSHCERELITDLRYQLDREREMRKDLEKRLNQVMCERDRGSLIVEDGSSAEEYIKEEVTEEFVVTDDLPQDLSCGGSVALGGIGVLGGSVAANSPSSGPEVTVISKPSVVVLPVHSVSMVAAQQLTPAPSPPRCHSPSSGASANSTAHNNAVTSRQNLDTIVEAIRHLEGDHMFQERRPTVTAVTSTGSRHTVSVVENSPSTELNTVNRSETVIVRSTGATTGNQPSTGSR